MNGIRNFLVDYNKSTHIENIERSPLEVVNSFTRKIKFYNPSISEPLHKFWYYVGNAKLIKKANGKISVVLSSTDTKFVESIKSLDEKVNDVLKSIHIKNIPDPSVIELPNFPPMMEFFVDGESNCFDQDDKPITYMRVKNGAKILLYVELDSVVINTTKTTRYWRVLQMKEIKSLDMSVNLFSSPITPDVKVGYVPLPVIPMQQHLAHSAPPSAPYGYPGYYPHPGIPMAPPNMMGIPPPPPPGTHTSVLQKPDAQVAAQTGSVFQAPSKDELLNMIGKLKKSSNQKSAEKNTEKNPRKSTEKALDDNKPKTPSQSDASTKIDSENSYHDQPVVPPAPSASSMSDAPDSNNSKSSDSDRNLSKPNEPSTKEHEKPNIIKNNSSIDDDTDFDTVDSSDSKVDDTEKISLAYMKSFIDEQTKLLNEKKKQRQVELTKAWDVIGSMMDVFEKSKTSSPSPSKTDDVINDVPESKTDSSNTPLSSKSNKSNRSNTSSGSTKKSGIKINIGSMTKQVAVKSNSNESKEEDEDDPFQIVPKQK